MAVVPADPPESGRKIFGDENQVGLMRCAFGPWAPSKSAAVRSPARKIACGREGADIKIAGP
jgi:hypothetical protein